MHDGRRSSGRAGSSGLISVHPGDTLYSLAFAYGCTPEELQRANPRHRLDARRLPVGAQLRLPGHGLRDAPWAKLDARLQRKEQRPQFPLRVLPVAVGFAVAAVVGAQVTPDFENHARRLAKEAGSVGVHHTQRLVHHSQRLVHQLFIAVGNFVTVFRRAMQGDRLGAAESGPASGNASLRAELARSKAETAAAKALAAAADARSEALQRELSSALAHLEQLAEAEQAQRQLAEDLGARVRELARQLTAVRQAAGDDLSA